MHLLDGAHGDAARLPDRLDDLGRRIRQADDLGQAAPCNQAARGKLDCQLIAGLDFRTYNNPGSPHRRSGVASATRSRSQLRLKVFFARSRKSTPSHAP